MGFGYLLLGYLLTFLLYLTVENLGFGFLALLLGYLLMALGLRELRRYSAAFRWSLWVLLPLLVPTLYDALVSLSELFLWDLGGLPTMLGAAMELSLFFLLILFNVTMLYAIRVLAGEVGLPSTEAAAIRNLLFVGAYAVLYLVCRLPGVSHSAAAPYLNVALLLLNLAWVFCNLFLLLSCNKNICSEGDEDQAPRESRMGWLNRLNAAYDRNHEILKNAARESRELSLEKKRQRSQARDLQKQHRNKKKK